HASSIGRSPPECRPWPQETPPPDAALPHQDLRRHPEATAPVRLYARGLRRVRGTDPLRHVALAPHSWPDGWTAVPATLRPPRAVPAPTHPAPTQRRVRWLCRARCELPRFKCFREVPEPHAELGDRQPSRETYQIAVATAVQVPPDP